MVPSHACIAGTGHYVPERVLSNHDLERRVDTSHAWIVERTGIVERRIAADNEVTSDMATKAAHAALEAAQLEAHEIDLIVVATVTPDMPLPSTAAFVQRKLGARHDCPSFDVSAACAGFLYALSIGEKFIRTSAARHVLVIGVELLSRIVNWQDRSTCVLFGDGAGAIVLSGTDDRNRGLMSTHLYTDGALAPSLCIPAGGSAEPISPEALQAGRHFVHMQGQDVFKFAVRALTLASKAAVEANDLGPNDIDHVIAHQANIRILEAVAVRCELPIE